MNRFLIACGGTGGHLAPGIALGEALVAAGHHCELVISEKPVDQRLIQKYPQLTFHSSPGAPFSLGPVKGSRFLWKQARGWLFSRRLIKKTKAEIVVGFGGFGCVGIALASLTERVPLVLHEANRVPGRMIRFFHHLPKRVYLPTGVRLKRVDLERVRSYGFPVRKEFQRMSQAKARKKLGLDPNRKTLVILGGSQGAQALNEWIIDKLDVFGLEGIQVFCLSGMAKAGFDPGLMATRDGQEIVAKFVPFSDQMPEILNAADLVVSRAGAGTIAELVHCQTPSILVPYPYAADNHQLANARYVEQQGGAILVEQDFLQDLHKEVLDTIFNDGLVRKLKNNLDRMHRGNTTELIVRDLERLAAEELRNRRMQRLEQNL
ncbi:MAG: UDP-N-acetylglucosamine--N-acetylmuramyl-(pentapeptide) pyrophosphoryl-undecaprenol N-acetylglucosamine transferase [Opitutales bacterium]|nr:UDP-N-acetylglucosamine--N-acetylmuramyl-(pentapeptide) pyrophosphoryl-undecaprenol N-acetylglucosamine transferase [Opitutales bacterium]